MFSRRCNYHLVSHARNHILQKAFYKRPFCGGFLYITPREILGDIILTTEDNDHVTQQLQIFYDGLRYAFVVVKYFRSFVKYYRKYSEIKLSSHHPMSVFMNMVIDDWTHVSKCMGWNICFVERLTELVFSVNDTIEIVFAE